MKKINLIDAVIDFLASDAAGDSKGVYHPEIVKVHLNNVFNALVYSTWKNGKAFSDYSQLDAWSRPYTVSVTGQVGAKAYCFLPFAPIQLPDNMGIRQVCDHADDTNVFAYLEATANVVFDELDVKTMDNTSTFRLQQNNLSTGAGEPSHMLILEKLPIAPATLIVSVDVMLIVPMDQIDDYDDISMPQELGDNIVRQVIDLMSKKQSPDTSNDQVNQK